MKSNCFLQMQVPTEFSMLMPDFQDYKKLFKEVTGDNYHPCESWNELTEEFKYNNDKYIQKLLKEKTEEAYLLFFEQYPEFKIIDKYYQFIYNPSKEMIDSEFKYYFGTDEYLYGWNIIGKTLEKIYYQEKIKDKNLIYIIYRVIQKLEELLRQGKNILIYHDKTVLELYKILNLNETNEENINYIYSQYKNQKIKDYDIINLEINYPKNIIIFLYMRKSRHFQNIIHENRNKLKMEYCLKLFEHETNQCVDNINRQDSKLMSFFNQLIQKKKVILNDETKKQIQQLNNIENNLDNNYKFPLNHIQHQTIILSENNEKISPLYRHVIYYDNKKFYCIFHLIYYLILIEMNYKKQKCYNLLYPKNMNQMIDLNHYNLDTMICKQFFNDIKNKYYDIIREKYETFQSIFSYLSFHPNISFQFHSDELIDYLQNYFMLFFIQKSKKSILSHSMFKGLFIQYDSYVVIENYLSIVSNMINYWKELNINEDNLMDVFNILFSNIYNHVDNFIQFNLFKDVSEKVNQRITESIFLIQKLKVTKLYSLQDIINCYLYLHQIKNINDEYIVPFFIGNKKENHNGLKMNENTVNLSPKNIEKLNIIINRMI